MTASPANCVPLLDLNPPMGDLVAEALQGLTSNPRTLPCKLFYDEEGSRLFDSICGTKEYYPTRTELAILDERLPEIARRVGPGALVIEYGAGSCTKTERLMNALDDPAGIIVLDISRDHLIASAEQLARDLPDVQVLPVCADYHAEFHLPSPDRPVNRRVAFFPGSTIGNFRPPEAVEFLRLVRRHVGDGGALLIGADLQKDPAILDRAYNDAGGYTEAFNLNVLEHLNREAGSDFDPANFSHAAFYNTEKHRIEMHLAVERDHSVHLNGNTIDLQAGETIRTEFSHKYTIGGFIDIARSAGFESDAWWTDNDDLFSVHLLRAV